MTVKISILLIFYNDAKYLTTAIKSILNQTFDNFELIMLDNGSNDGSSTIAKQHAQQDSRIKIIKSQQNYHNGSLNFRKLLAHSKGKYIKFFCADDIMTPNCLNTQIELLENNNQYLGCFSHMECINDNGKLLKQSHNATIKNNRFEYLNHLFYSYHAFTFPTAMVKKSAITNDMLDPRLIHFSDIKLWIKLLMKGEIFVIKDKLVQYRIRDNQGNVSNIAENDKKLKSYLFELHLLYDEFFQINNFELYTKIFPESQKYLNKLNQQTDQDILPFITAILLYNSEKFKPFHFSLHRNIALLTIFRIIKDENLMSKITKKLDFDYLSLYKLTSNFCEALNIDYSRKKRNLIHKLWYKFVARKKYKKLAKENKII